jgi:hypothetical protein
MDGHVIRRDGSWSEPLWNEEKLDIVEEVK